jgi:zinc transport system substrate-binding protein
VAIAAVVAASGCTSDDGSARAGDKPEVVASFFPLAEAARAAGGALVDVRDLTPSGAEPHDLEVTPREVDAIERADLVIVMGRDFQPAVEELAKRGDRTLFVLDALGIPDDDVSDPHVWLDPSLMGRVFELVRARMPAIDMSSADSFANEVKSLDETYEDALRECDRRTIVTSHEAFGHLAERYHLREEAIAGIEPSQEPSADRIGELADLVRREGVTTVFTEELVSPRIAETLAREAGGVTTAVLDPLESEARDNGGYTRRMMENLEVLRTALGCS